MEYEKKIAVLLDADNVSPKYISSILTEIVNHGVPTYKRIYGDWTKPQLSSWKEELLNYSITPIQQYNYTTGKNSTDSALIIDAMDILYSGNVGGFCIVSSDSDFTRLASRLRESGMYVVGMGEAKTPKPFVSACESFKYLESLAEDSQNDVQSESTKLIQGAMKKEDLMHEIKKIIEEKSDDNGWISLADMGNILNRRFSDFDSRNYGYSKLLHLLKSFNCFDVAPRKNQNPNGKQNYYVRVREE
ncbi:NYN domain-containing protein [Scatolibacter rhodanostii]|uniref:NYN domain-containing protein n=1 Tax=Scatolibacter rhodanostii TaxID=2014781 RepID=UPI000C07785D|nr:NYN domain-containing protein [Scatolibacter rhodanostii]